MVHVAGLCAADGKTTATASIAGIASVTSAASMGGAGQGNVMEEEGRGRRQKGKEKRGKCKWKC